MADAVTMAKIEMVVRRMNLVAALSALGCHQRSVATAAVDEAYARVGSSAPFEEQLAAALRSCVEIAA